MEDRILELIEDKVNDIFLQIQTENGIESGDMNFEDEYDLRVAMEKMAKVIARSIA